MTTQRSPRPDTPRGPRSSGPDPEVAWSVTLHVLSFPWILAALVALALVVSALDVDLGSAQDVGTQAVLVAGFVLVALIPLVASAIIGLRVWRRRRRRAGLIVGCMSVVLGIVVLILAGRILTGAVAG